MATFVDVPRAWKDESYRNSLTPADRASLPPHPAGMIELPEAEVSGVHGGSTEHILTWGCCNGFTTDPSHCTFSCLDFTSGTSCQKG